MQSLTEFVDSIIILLDKAADSTGVVRAALHAEIYRMLTTLKEGIRKDQQGAEKLRKFLEEQLRDAGRQLAGEEPLQTSYHLNLDDEPSKEENQNGRETASS